MIRLCAHLGYQFGEHEPVARFAVASRAGFTAVEHPAPYALAPDALAGLVAQHGLTFVQLATPMGDAARREKGLAALPGREAEFRDGVDRAIVYARATGAKFVHAMAGLVPAGKSLADLWPTYIDNLRFAADELARAGRTLLIEPIGAGTIAGYAVDSPDVALRALRDAARPNTRLLFDTFHAIGAGVDPIAFFQAHADSIAHVQIADFPGRHEPGTGSFDFGRFFDVVADSDYAGHLGCEYVPLGDTAAGLAWRERYGVRFG
jgi:hydroxypyruvate isomerase